MASKSDIVKPKAMKVYELDDFDKLIKGVKVASCMLTEPYIVVDEESVIRRLSALTLNGATEGNCCSSCRVGPFESRSHQTAHYKHHWHTHNLKRKLFGRPPVTYIQYNARQDEDSSMSSSDSEEESASPESELFAAATRHCKAFFSNQSGQVFCIYRCILHHRKEELSTDGEGRAWVERCSRLGSPGAQRWAVLMVSGGHFAGAVFAGGAAVVHKTLHSYVTRRGQGHAQAARDQHGAAPRSAGASLRRYNQAQFLEHVQDILAGWAEDLAGCSLVLYRAVGSTNQAAVFGKGSPLRREDPRVRPLPFPTRKPTYKEVQRAHATVANIEVYDTMELFQKALIASAASKSAAKSGSDTSAPSGKKAQKSGQHKPVDRAKSRERAPRELPTSVMSSEDEGPCYIDSETPLGWIKALSEQSTDGVITGSRRDLLNDCSIATTNSTGRSDSETEATPGKKEQQVKRKKKKKQDDAKKQDIVKKAPQKISANVKKMWKAISGEGHTSLASVVKGWGWGGAEVAAACNARDPADGNTALHKAAIADKPEMVTELLLAGGDPCVRNLALQTPYAACAHPAPRHAFRLFQAAHPDKYNYAKSHIPGPLTPELAEQEKERKAQQRRAKRQRDKERHADKVKAGKFLELTDAQKVQAKEARCFLCGTSLPKVPFEYDTYKFCTIRCLQNHRHVRPLNMSVQ